MQYYISICCTFAKISRGLLGRFRVSGNFFFFSSFFFITDGVITALLALPRQSKHIIITEVPCAHYQERDLVQEMLFLHGDYLCLPGLSQRSPAKWSHQTQWRSNGIPLFSPHRVTLKSESLLTWVLTKTEQWMAVCKAFFSYPIYRHYPRELHSHEAQGLTSCLDCRSRYLRPPLIFFFGILVARLTELHKN